MSHKHAKYLQIILMAAVYRITRVLSRITWLRHELVCHIHKHKHRQHSISIID